MPNSIPAAGGGTDNVTLAPAVLLSLSARNLSDGLRFLDQLFAVLLWRS